MVFRIYHNLIIEINAIISMNNESNLFVNLFGYNSFLMYELFEFLSDKNQDSNNLPDIHGIVSSCKIMYETCDLYWKNARFLWTISTRFDEKKRSHVQILYYNSIDCIGDQLNQYDNLKRVVFGYDFNQPLMQGVLPKSLKYLTFGEKFNIPLDPGVLPPSIKHLTFGKRFNQPLMRGVLPGSLTHLSFGRWFNHPLIPGIFPGSLNHLEFGHDFNLPLYPGVLPPSLNHLEFGHDFNQQLKVGVLPQSLEYLVFDPRYDQPMESGILPKTLIHLMKQKK
jgi:hypothetical protein